MNRELAQKVAIVSGGARGIGQAVVENLAAEGVQTVFIDKDEAAGTALERSQIEQGAQVTFMHADLLEKGVCEEAVRVAEQRFGGVDIVVNNAGVNDHIGLEATTEEFIGSLGRNLFHCFELVKAARPFLIRSKGRIINIGSKVAYTGQGGTSGYAAAKGALMALTREWAVDFAKDEVTVNMVVPAEVYTPLYEKELALSSDPDRSLAQVKAAIPLGNRLTTPAEIAHAVLFFCSPSSGHITGQHLHVDGGYTHLDRMHDRRDSL